MKSMYTILAETTAGFNEAQHKEFNRRSRDLGSGASAETLVNIAESVSKDETLRESGGIRRNNGASTYAESDRILMQGLAKARPHSFGKLAELKKAERRLTPQQQKDKEFCLLLGMSEADATRVATSNCIYGQAAPGAIWVWPINIKRSKEFKKRAGRYPALAG